jgi:hypothetical protein
MAAVMTISETSGRRTPRVVESRLDPKLHEQRKIKPPVIKKLVTESDYSVPSNKSRRQTALLFWDIE